MRPSFPAAVRRLALRNGQRLGLRYGRDRQRALAKARWGENLAVPDALASLCYAWFGTEA
jgi:hypothetical protein